MVKIIDLCRTWPLFYRGSTGHLFYHSSLQLFFPMLNPPSQQQITARGFSKLWGLALGRDQSSKLICCRYTLWEGYGRLVLNSSERYSNTIVINREKGLQNAGAYQPTTLNCRSLKCFGYRSGDLGWGL